MSPTGPSWHDGRPSRASALSDLSKSPGKRRFIYLNGGEGAATLLPRPLPASPSLFCPLPLFLHHPPFIVLLSGAPGRAKKGLPSLSWEKSPPPLGLPSGLLPPRGTEQAPPGNLLGESGRISPCRPVSPPACLAG